MKILKVNLFVSGIYATSIAASLSLFNILPASANTASANNQKENYALVSLEQNSSQITPNNLVESAYQCGFKDQGIASYITFTTEVRENELTAQDLVKSAISANKLSPNTINDSGYIHVVTVALQNLAKSDM